MVFSSLLFLFFFLPITLLLYLLSPQNTKNIILLLVSLLFYAWGEPIYVFLMIGSACVDYVIGRLIAKYRINSPVKAKIALIGSLVTNLAVLSFFKYADFLVININQLIGTDIEPLELALPIGISFYTFQTMSYSIDVYRGKMPPQDHFLDFAMYVAFFPQLVAGPIVRYESMMHDLRGRTWDGNLFLEGVKQFIIGLGKKVLIANNIGSLWRDIQSQNVGDLSLLTSWLGIIAFALQIYFDFSGYSDMAVGLGKMFGFRFPKNFDYPYISTSVTEFWRRWHMTLGNWFKDYVYIPLGGNRVGKWMNLRNLLIVWGLTGLWHGASWNFVLWGLYFGVLIIVEKVGLLRLLEKLPAVCRHAYLIFVILIGWVLFAFDDIIDGFHYMQIMFGFSAQSISNTQFMYYGYTYVVILVIAIIGSTPFFSKIKQSIHMKNAKKWIMFQDAFLLPVCYIAILVLSTAYLVDESYNPFLYFRF